MTAIKFNLTGIEVDRHLIILENFVYLLFQKQKYIDDLTFKKTKLICVACYATHITACQQVKHIHFPINNKTSAVIFH